MLALPLSIAAIPLQVLKWLWDITRAAELRIRLQRERSQLHTLRKLRDLQHQALLISPTDLLICRVNEVSYQVDKSDTEKAIRIEVGFFNLSVFDVRLEHWSFDSRMPQQSLVHTPNTTSLPPRLRRCSTVRNTIIQPVAEETAASIRDLIEQHVRIEWHFVIRAEGLVGDEPITGQLAWDIRNSQAG